MTSGNGFQSQCGTCGRVPWTPTSKITTAKGSKARQGQSEVGDYRAWRWEWGGGAYVTDVDQVEWRIEDGRVRAAAVIELTCVRGNKKIPQTYLDAIRDRFDRDFQGRAATSVADALGCEAYIVVWRENLEDFWLYNLTRDRGWRYMDRKTYKCWLEKK